MTAQPHQDVPRLRLVFWETTGRCNLRCAHCRRLPQTEHEPDLTTDQGRALIDAVAGLGRPVLVFSGGEPLLREDLDALAGYARSRGLPTALATNGTLVGEGQARRIAAAGFGRVAVSLDSPDAARHDAFRGQAGAFERAVAGARALRRAGVSLQVNATLFAGNVRELDGLYGLARGLEATALHLFVLVPVGCGLTLGEREQLTPNEVEDVLAWVCRMQARGEVEVRATCAPMYHRVARQWLAANPAAEGAERVMGSSRGGGCLAGTGVLFVSHAGDVLPCGYFPVSCGSILRQPLGEIWRSSPVLGELRDRRLLAGKCGRCDFKDACGGCRARAFAAYGEWTAEDPICAYSPPRQGA